MRTRINSLVFIPLAWLFMSTTVNACGCMGGFVIAQPCNSYWKFDVIFIGTVSEIGPPNPVEGSNGKLFTHKGRYTRFTVEEAFRGVFTETFETSSHGSSCDFSFKIGERYFVYAARSPEDGKVYVSSCSPTTTLDRAGPDTVYARGRTHNEASPSIIGIVSRETRKRYDEYRNREGLEGIRVTASAGGRVQEAFTDAKGVFRFYDLAPGNYQVKALTAAGLQRLYGKEIVMVQVAGQQCGGAEFAVTSLPTLSGKVLDNARSPIKVRLNLVPVDAGGEVLNPAEGSIETYSNDQGDYKFAGLAPGRYLIAVNWRDQPGSHDPSYPRAYLPGVQEKAKAQIIEIADGEQLSAPDFQLPPALSSRTIEGIAVLPDGSPAANTLIQVHFTARQWFEVQSTDINGRFTLKLFEGFKYVVVAELRKEIQGVWRATHSPPVEITVGPLNQPLTLVISESGFYRPQQQKKNSP